MPDKSKKETPSANVLEDLFVPPLIVHDLDPPIQQFAVQYAKAVLTVLHPDINPDDQPKANLFKQISGIRDGLEVDVILGETLRRLRRRYAKPKSFRLDTDWTSHGKPTPALIYESLHGSVRGWHSLKPTLSREQEQKEIARAIKEQQEREVVAIRDRCLEVLSGYLIQMVEQLATVLIVNKASPMLSRSGTAAFPTPHCSILVENSLYSAIATKIGMKLDCNRTDLPPLLELVVQPNGSIEQYKIERIHFDPRTETVPSDIPSEWIINPVGTQGWYYRRTGKLGPFPGSLLGAVNKERKPGDQLDDIDLRRPPWWQEFVGDSNTLYVEEGSPGYALEQFRGLAPYLTPFIQFLSPLVVIDLQEIDNPRLRIFGSVLAVRRLSSSSHH